MKKKLFLGLLIITATIFMLVGCSDNAIEFEPITIDMPIVRVENNLLMVSNMFDETGVEVEGTVANGELISLLEELELEVPEIPELPVVDVMLELVSVDFYEYTATGNDVEELDFDFAPVTISTNENGAAEFGYIEFAHAGTFVFEVSQVEMELYTDFDWQMDINTMVITVTITEDTENEILVASILTSSNDFNNVLTVDLSDMVQGRTVELWEEYQEYLAELERIAEEERLEGERLAQQNRPINNQNQGGGTTAGGGGGAINTCNATPGMTWEWSTNQCMNEVEACNLNPVMTWREGHCTSNVIACETFDGGFWSSNDMADGYCQERDHSGQNCENGIAGWRWIYVSYGGGSSNRVCVRRN